MIRKPARHLFWHIAICLICTGINSLSVAAQTTVNHADASDDANESLIAFQSYRDGNWEIYLANGDGTQPKRLTNHAASDVWPKLNLGARKIAFASNRSGVYEIYTMNSDGTNLKQITTAGKDAHDPSWAPDSTQIMFSARDDSQQGYSIYVVDAEGGMAAQVQWGAGSRLSQPDWHTVLNSQYLYLGCGYGSDSVCNLLNGCD